LRGDKIEQCQGTLNKETMCECKFYILFSQFSLQTMSSKLTWSINCDFKNIIFILRNVSSHIFHMLTYWVVKRQQLWQFLITQIIKKGQKNIIYGKTFFRFYRPLFIYWIKSCTCVLFTIIFTFTIVGNHMVNFLNCYT
jgi:hypothetical protein